MMLTITPKLGYEMVVPPTTLYLSMRPALFHLCSWSAIGVVGFWRIVFKTLEVGCMFGFGGTQKCDEVWGVPLIVECLWWGENASLCYTSSLDSYLHWPSVRYYRRVQNTFLFAATHTFAWYYQGITITHITHCWWSRTPSLPLCILEQACRVWCVFVKTSLALQKPHV